jgi:hypothetical protein
MQRYQHSADWQPKPDQPYWFAYWDYCRPCLHTQHYETAKRWPPRPSARIAQDAIRKQRERKLGNYSETVRPNPNVPIGWPSDNSIPPWATEDEIAAYKRQR